MGQFNNDTKILLVDDCFESLGLVKAILKPHNVTGVDCISDAKAAIEEDNYDLILIDIGLPDGDGFELLNYLSIHPYYKGVPKIMLTSRAEVSSKVMGLEHGAYDYITKPFHPLEFKARVQLQLNRLSGETRVIQKGFVKLDLNKQLAFYLDKEQWVNLELTPIEFKILLLLIQNAGTIKNRAELKREIWGSEKISIEIKGIDTHIAHIRKKLGPFSASIVTAYGTGYYFDPKDPSDSNR